MEKILFYDYEYKNFYLITERPKTIRIEWLKAYNCDGKKLNQNIKIEDSILKENSFRKEDDEYIIYFSTGKPLILKKATLDIIKNEIEDCKKWGISYRYYEDLKDLL